MRSAVSVVQQRVVVLLAVLLHVVTCDGERLKEVGSELLLEALGRILGDRQEGPDTKVLIPNEPFAGLSHNTEIDLAPLVAETTLEWGIRFVGLGIEAGSSIAEMEATTLVASAGECEGNKRECDCDA